MFVITIYFINTGENPNSLQTIDSNYLGIILTQCFRKGFEEERVESVLHQIELQLKHQTSHYGRSLMMVMDVCVSWYCGIDVWRTL